MKIPALNKLLDYFTERKPKKPFVAATPFVDLPATPLNASDRRNMVWQKVEKHLNDRLAMHRMKNDNDLDAEKTAKLRGSIQEIKHLLNLGKDNKEESE